MPDMNDRPDDMARRMRAAKESTLVERIVIRVEQLGGVVSADRREGLGEMVLSELQQFYQELQDLPVGSAVDEAIVGTAVKCGYARVDRCVNTFRLLLCFVAGNPCRGFLVIAEVPACRRRVPTPRWHI